MDDTWRLLRPWTFFALLVSFPTSTYALQSFELSCTLPNITETFYYVSSPDARGSLNIVWTCLTTLILCTYSVLHPNVPEQRRGRDPGFWGDVKWSTVWPSVFWSVVGILMPEFLLAKSVVELYEARKTLRLIHETVSGAAESWTLTHMFFANMGGYAIEYESKLPPSSVAPSSVEAIKQRLQRLDSETLFGSNRNPTTRQLFQLNGDIIVEALRNAGGTLPSKPPTTQEEIMDKSKANWFGKALAIVQLVSFYLSFFARITERLPITQLELAVAAIALYSLIIYACLLPKPKSVLTTTTMVQFPGPIPDQILDIIKEKQSRGFWGDETEDFLDKTPSFRTFGTHQGSDHSIEHFVLFGLMSIPLGAIHLAGWSLDFPSNADLWLWRSAAFVTTAAAPCSFIMIVLLPIMSWFIPKRILGDLDWRSTVLVLFFPATILLYIIGRIVLIVEVVRCLFYLPPRAFAAPRWTLSLPHFG